MRLPPLLLALLLLPAPLHAQTVFERAYGDWTVAAGRTPGDGLPLCAMVGGEGARTFQTVWMARDGAVRLRLSDPAWRLDPGVRPPVRLVIDGRSSWSTTAAALTPAMVEIVLRPDEWTAWERAWRRGLLLEAAFPESLVPTWRLGLRGTHRATDAFRDCVAQAR